MCCIVLIRLTVYNPYPSLFQGSTSKQPLPNLYAHLHAVQLRKRSLWFQEEVLQGDKEFQPGENVIIEIAYQAPTRVTYATIVFVHEMDQNEHIVLSQELPKEIGGPAPQIKLRLAAEIGQEQKPGHYRLDYCQFQTFTGKIVNPRNMPEVGGFQVVPERDWSPFIEYLKLKRETDDSILDVE